MITESEYTEEALPSACFGMIGSRIVAPGTRVSAVSRFADPFWDMTSLVTLPGLGNFQKSWNFESVPGYPGGFALALAEYAYSRLYKPVVTHDRRGEWLTVFNELTSLSSFVEFCFSQGRTSFQEVDNRLLDQYLKHISFNERKSDERIRMIFQSIYRVWEYRSELTEPIPALPFGRPFPKMFSGKGRGNENKTPPIPEPIYSAIMGAALDYLLEYGPRLLNAWQQLQSYWSELQSVAHLTKKMKLLRLQKRARKILGETEWHWRTAPLTTYGHLYKELSQLRTACTLIILAYSGIRSSELLSLEAGCYVLDKGVDGQVIYYINTVLHKHRPGGSRDTWVVIEEVVKAIKCLEILTKPIRGASNDKRLMLTDSTSGTFSVQKDFTGRDVSEFTFAAIVYQIHSFRNHCNSYLSRAPIPKWLDDSGTLKPWHFNVRQFRRTLARYIARQPFGIIAGMLQYKHVEVAVFEGYAGAEPEWNKLLEQEKVLASVDILGELAMDLSNGAVAGQIGNQLKTEFMTEFKGRAEDFPPSQIVKWLASTHKALFVGKFNFCFFDPLKALCTKNAEKKDRPILNFCQPGKCCNACVANRHKPMWEAQLNQAKEFSTHTKTSEFQRQILRTEVVELESVINDLMGEHNAR